MRARGTIIGALTLALSGCPAHSPASAQSPSTPKPASESAPRRYEADYDKPIPAKISIKDTVEVLAGEIGERNLEHPEQLAKTRSYLQKRLERAGYQVTRAGYNVKSKGIWAENLVAERKSVALPQNPEVIVVGAHYDSVLLTPGANDNGSGTAVLLQLAERLSKVDFERSVRFVFFVNEEPPYFMTEEMGSEVYARECAARHDKIVGMLSLETMGYYSDQPDSQHFPVGVTGYPSTGNFLAFICDPASKPFLTECLQHFEGLPAENLVAPQFVKGVDWSDHASFWHQGYPALMVTDTAPFRYPHYHKRSDTPDKLDYKGLDLAADGLEKVLRAVGKERAPSAGSARP